MSRFACLEEDGGDLASSGDPTPPCSPQPKPPSSNLGAGAEKKSSSAATTRNSSSSRSVKRNTSSLSSSSLSSSSSSSSFSTSTLASDTQGQKASAERADVDPCEPAEPDPDVVCHPLITEAGCDAHRLALSLLTVSECAGVDLEGERLGAEGSLATVQVCPGVWCEAGCRSGYSARGTDGCPGGGGEGKKCAPQAFVFDFVAMGEPGLRWCDASSERTAVSLADMLSGTSPRSEQLLWVIHDARSDAEALFAHAGGIRLSSARLFDTQVADLFLRRARGFISRLRTAEKHWREEDEAHFHHLEHEAQKLSRRDPERAAAQLAQIRAHPPGPSKRAQSHRRDPSPGRPPNYLHGFARSLAGRVADAERLAAYKSRGKSAMANGDDGAVWMRRPLARDLVEYAALDAGLALALHSEMGKELGEDGCGEVERISRAWAAEWLDDRVRKGWGRETAAVPERLLELVDETLLALRAERKLLGKVNPVKV